MEFRVVGRHDLGMAAQTEARHSRCKNSSCTSRSQYRPSQGALPTLLTRPICMQPMWSPLSQACATGAIRVLSCTAPHAHGTPHTAGGLFSHKGCKVPRGTALLQCRDYHHKAL